MLIFGLTIYCTVFVQGLCCDPLRGSLLRKSDQLSFKYNININISIQLIVASIQKIQDSKNPKTFNFLKIIPA